MGIIGWLVSAGFCALGVAAALWGLTELNKTIVIWFVAVPGAFLLIIAAGLEFQELSRVKPELTEIERRQLRAYVTLTKIVQIPLIPEVGKPFEIKVEFMNTGKSPARKVTGHCVNEGIKRGEKPSFNYSTIEPSLLGSMAQDVPHFIELFPIGSRSEPGRKNVPIDADLMQTITSEDYRIYVHGRWDYEDDFKRPHWMTFCYWLTVPFNGHFSVCPYHNETDQE
jgi:hypothetical protein